MKKVLLLPEWLKSLKLYEGSIGDFSVNRGELEEESRSADYVVGLSTGALIALENIEKITGKVLLINPPLPKRSLVAWFVRWIKYIASEGLFFERQTFSVNPMRWISGLITCLRLLNIDFSRTLEKIPKDKIIVIRGKGDAFFCDEVVARFLAAKQIEVTEVEGGHNWSEGIERTMNSLISQNVGAP